MTIKLKLVSGPTLTVKKVAGSSIKLTVLPHLLGVGDGDYGDITVSGDGTVFTIDNDVVSNAKLADMPAWSVKVRNDGTSGDPSDAQVGDIAEESAPAAGDFLFGFLAGGELRKFDVDNLPGGVADGDYGDIAVSGGNTQWTVESVQGFTFTPADAGADAFFGWDDSVGAYENLTAAEALAIILTVDGTGSGLDADLLDGQHASEFQPIDSDLTSWAGVTRAAGFDTFAATPSSANLRGLLTDETGTGLAYFQGGDAGTPSAIVLTNATGLTTGGVAAATLVTAADTVAGNDNDTSWPTTAAIIDYAQPLDSDLTAIAALTTTAFGRGLLELADEDALEALLDTLPNLTSIQGRTVTFADAGFDVVSGWDDSASAHKNFLLADIATEGSPANGDFLLIYGAEGDLRKVDWSDLPSGSGSPGGNDTTIQYNDMGSFAGDDDLTWVVGSGMRNQLHMALGFADVDTPFFAPGDPINGGAGAFSAGIISSQLFDNPASGAGIVVWDGLENTSMSSGSYSGVDIEPVISSDSTGNFSFLFGIFGGFYDFGSGDILAVYGLNYANFLYGTGTVSENNDLATGASAIGGDVTLHHGIQVLAAVIDGGTLGDAYGIRIHDHSGIGASGDNWNIWSEGADSLNVFEGSILLDKYQEFTEMTAPSAPAANKARLFTQDNGSGKTQLAVLFPSGAAQIIATEP